MRSLPLATAVTLTAVALTLAGCTSSDDQPGDAASPGTQPSTAAGAPTTSATDAGSAPASDTPSAGGTTTATAASSPLTWSPLPGEATDTATTNGTWTLTVGQDSDWWSLGRNSSGAAKQTKPPAGLEVADSLLSDEYAVIVYGDADGAKQQRAVVIALDSGKTTAIGKSSALPPSTDGSWALDGSTLWYATDHDSAYCLASSDLGSGASELGWCAPDRQGFTNIVAADGHTSMMTFDDSQPSCRTLVTVSGSQTTSYPDVPDCKGAQGAVLGSGSGPGTSKVWSMVPNENRYQQVHMYASASGGVVDLGLGVNRTLTVCGSAAYWARDKAGSAPAALMRWDGRDLSVAYESKGFLGEPLCAGHTLSILDSSDSGDQQLTAAVS